MPAAVILHGVPGSGKTTLARTLQLWVFPSARIISADTYFECGDKYVFDPAKLHAAHAVCYNAAEGCVGRQEGFIFDNTNIKRAHWQKYEELAKANRYEVIHYYIKCDPTIAFKRCTHGVPLTTVQRMDREMDYND